MQKDVIYIDTEDDITAIIGKVKASDSHIVALVPPKRIGAIQSVVNLKLVERAAAQVDKRLVIITNNQALAALATSVRIPIAKNLQSKPELAEAPESDIDDDEDIIDGSDIQKETAASAVETVADAESIDAAARAIADDPAKPRTPSNMKRVGTATVGAAAIKFRGKKRITIPNFDKFRKILFLAIAGVIALVAFLIWAIAFAPHATITISAKTTPSALNSKVVLGSAETTSLQNGTLKSVTKTMSKAVSVPFTATGQKDIGNKATGAVQFSNSTTSAKTVPAGTSLTTSDGSVFTVDADVAVPAGTVTCTTIFNCKGTAGTASGSITASQPGDKYNGETGNLGGTPSGISATLTNATSGGTSNVVTIVQQSDVDAVSSSIVSSADSDAAKQTLTDQFGSDYVVLPDTFKTDTSAVKPTPAVGDQATDGKGALAGNVTFSLVGVAKSELAAFLNAYFAQQIAGQSNQKVYDNGVSSVSFASVTPGDKDTWSAAMSTNGKIGPNIDINSLKSYAQGKKLGEIKTYVESVPGVNNADVSFSPFWVVTAPNDVNRIKVEFQLNG